MRHGLQGLEGAYLIVLLCVGSQDGNPPNSNSAAMNGPGKNSLVTHIVLRITKHF